MAVSFFVLAAYVTVDTLRTLASGQHPQVSWPGIARITRSLVLGLRNELFVDAAIACGTRPATILLRHCLPNIMPALIVRASVGIGFLASSASWGPLAAGAFPLRA